jgi:hypothetical protein
MALPCDAGNEVGNTEVHPPAAAAAGGSLIVLSVSQSINQ